jgi:pyridoxamine 5'-phosphate oxidase-like protein
MAHYDQNQKEVRTGDQGSQHRPLRGLRPTPIENTGPSDRNHRNRQSKLAAAESQNLVAFQADEYDEQTQSGWSVLVNGRAEAVDEEAEIQRLSQLGLHPWVTAVERPFWIRIRPTSVSGWQTPGTS